MSTPTVLPSVVRRRRLARASLTPKHRPSAEDMLRSLKFWNARRHAGLLEAITFAYTDELAERHKARVNSR